MWARTRGHLIRFFEAKDAAGNVIAGTYIGIQDYPGAGNYDYNDHMFVIKNVERHDLTSANDANGDDINDALQLDADNDGTVNFFDVDTTPPVGPQVPFNSTDTPWAVDADGLTLAGAQYDDGGQGVAYNDAAGLQGGTAGGRTGSDVEVTAGGAIGWIDDGEWLEYTIEVQQAGEHTLVFQSALLALRVACSAPSPLPSMRVWGATRPGRWMSTSRAAGRPSCPPSRSP